MPQNYPIFNKLSTCGEKFSKFQFSLRFENNCINPDNLIRLMFIFFVQHSTTIGLTLRTNYQYHSNNKGNAYKLPTENLSVKNFALSSLR